MSVIREIQWDSLYPQPCKQWLLALGLALTPWFAAPCWAENYNLDSIAIKTSEQQTSIMLHTGSIVPVQKVLTSENKLILEIDQVNATETIRTNFTGAANISHVILQPINEHKIRLIVRGENLAPPSVAFSNPNTETASNARSALNNSSESFQQQTQDALRQIQESGIQPASLNTATQFTKQTAANTPTVNQPPAKGKAATPPPESTTLPEAESVPFGGLGSLSEESPLASQPAVTGLPKSATSDKLLDLPATETPSAENPLLENAKNGHYNNYLLGGLLALMALGMGGAVVHKIMKLKQVEPDLEALILEQHNGKKVSFREMADAYRNKHDKEPKAEMDSTQLDPPTGKKHAEDLIGLSSLGSLGKTSAASKPTPPKTALPAPSPMEQLRDPFGGKTPTMEQLISMVQAVSEPKQKPMKTPAPAKQAVNQYKQAEKPKSQPKTIFPDETMVKEMKRAQALQQELLQQAQQQIASAQANTLKPKGGPVNRAAAAQKAAVAQKTVKPVNFKNAPATNPLPTGKSNSPAARTSAGGNNGPLPGNPEVLNFLRNVADLMEKDGKPQIASSIHKNLNPNTLR